MRQCRGSHAVREAFAQVVVGNAYLDRLVEWQLAREIGKNPLRTLDRDSIVPLVGTEFGIVVDHGEAGCSLLSWRALQPTAVEEQIGREGERADDLAGDRLIDRDAYRSGKI